MNPTHEHRETDETDETDTGRDVRAASAERKSAAPEPEASGKKGEPPAAGRPTGWSRPGTADAPEPCERTARPEGIEKAEGARGTGTPAPAARTERSEQRERPDLAERSARSGTSGRPARRAQDGPVPAPGAPPAVNGAADKLQQRLQHAVGGFVDEPRHSVEEADEVLGEATDRLIEELRSRRRELRSDWQGGEQGKHGGGDTEKLRVALQGYRDLVDRVLRV
ncbi:hypothetical protein [Streptomyces sp. NPDC001070]